MAGEWRHGAGDEVARVSAKTRRYLPGTDERPRGALSLYSLPWGKYRGSS
jgi:hypothetical protein